MNLQVVKDVIPPGPEQPIHKKNIQNPVYLKGRGCPSKVHWSCIFIMKKSIFIPAEILDMDGLNNITECAVLSIYKYYTEKGDRHCCTLRNEDICKMTKLNERTLQRIKKYLKELGYIRTDGGIRVYYTGVRGDKTDTPGATKLTEGVTLVSPGGDKTDTLGVTKLVVKGDTGVAHNKEEKRKKEIKKEEKSEMTNFDLLISKLPSEYRTPERIDYIKNNFLEGINESDFTVGGALDMCLTKIKAELNNALPVEYKVEKKEPVSNTIDLF